ncbi:MAG: hypothetical protein Tsb009_23520 [Planctomycetaceae bacterium]
MLNQETNPLISHPDDIPTGYELVGCRTDGSFAEICKVRNRETGTLAALKRLRPEWRNQPEARALFQAEVNAASCVNSEHVVRLLDAELDTPSPWLLLEWLEGETLEQRLARGEKIPVSTAVWIARQTVQGLSDLSRAGFVHGDLKPENIFLCYPGIVKILDLGFAHRLERTSEFSENKLLVGTAEYLAPEALSAELSNPLAKDVYSLGIILFRMLAGRLPFTGQNTADILRLQRQAKPPALHILCPEAPSELVDLVERMLAKQPLRRPLNLRELSRTLIRLEIDLLAIAESAYREAS